MLARLLPYSVPYRKQHKQGEGVMKEVIQKAGTGYRKHNDRRQENPYSRRRVGCGFSLIELLGVIAIVMVLIGLLVPAVQAAINKARTTRTLNNGRNCFLAIMATATDGDRSYADSGTYGTSTDYWRWLITNRYYDATFAACAAYGVVAYEGTDPSIFTASNNAWCFVADINDATPASTPVMFTRNLNIANLGETTDYASMLTDESPFSQSGVGVIRLNGQVEFLKKQEINARFNPCAVSNAVLRP
jgi:type II secretory pathway pseudopilin PulG